MTFSKSRILSVQQLIEQISESNRNGERFCFILGSGASVESGIPSGNELEMKWMDCIMGKERDRDTPPRNPEVTKKTAQALKEEGAIAYSFEEIRNAWEIAKNEKRSISSKYYFDIYKLRFYPNRRNGHRYMESLMESCEPSIGYHTLALLLTNKNMNNLVITTNFDSLVEDALFLYTTKKPLVVNHESLAGYIESDIQRPIVAKVHRGLMYEPFNSPETTDQLKKEWQDTLNYALNTYTPIVIGYGGGDHSLMDFLKDEHTMLRHGIYWCFRKVSGLPDQDILDFLEKKDGYLVEIGGFDALMLEIGNAIFPSMVAPGAAGKILQNQCDKRIQKYNEQWKKLKDNPDAQEIVQSLNREEEQAEEKREKENALTALDYMRRGYRALNDENYTEAVEAFTKAIELRSDIASDYFNRGFAFAALGNQEKAIADYTKAIELNPNDAEAYNNRGCAFGALDEHEKALVDFNIAIELDPSDVSAYKNRGIALVNLGQYSKAISDYNRVAELDPKDAVVYTKRGYVFGILGEHEKALADFTVAIDLNPSDISSYKNRGLAFMNLGQYSEAISDYSRAIELDPMDASVYYKRGCAFVEIGEHDKAITDLSAVIELDPNNSEAYGVRGGILGERYEYERAIADFNIAIEQDPNDVFSYNNRGYAYSKLGDYEKALADYTSAIELNPMYVGAYNNRAFMYNSIGDHEKALIDCTKAIELDPHCASLYNNRGNTYFALEQYEKVLEDCTKAIELDPQLKKAYLNRAKAYRAMGDENLAQADENQASKL